MGTISARKRANGTVAYTAQIRIKRDGKVVYSQAETFARKQNAATWLRNRESELDVPGAVAEAIAAKTSSTNATLADAIDKYIKETNKEIGRTKAQVLAAIKRDEIADMDCRRVTSDQIVAFGKRLRDGDRDPSTVGNYISHLAAVFAIAKPAWKFDLDVSQMDAAKTVLSRMGAIGKSNSRDRRPTLAELDLLMTHFHSRFLVAPKTVPMHAVIAFALFSTRRQEEIVTLKWENYEKEHSRILVRNMKHPGQKIGNHVWCELPESAAAIIDAQPKRDERIFPYTTDAVSANFSRACLFLGIKDLRFHDLRHEGVSRQFEMGKTIPQAAAVSGHRSWSSLQRYAHIRQNGDKYERWKWLDIIT